MKDWTQQTDRGSVENKWRYWEKWAYKTFKAFWCTWNGIVVLLIGGKEVKMGLVFEDGINYNACINWRKKNLGERTSQKDVRKLLDPCPWIGKRTLDIMHKWNG